VATGRLPGQSPGLQVVRWSKAPTAGTTTLSGLDDYSVGLTYTAGYESVYLNGVLLDRTTDYTATNGTTIVLTTATVAGDIVNVFGTQISPVNGSLPTSTYTTKGDILVATANNTPVRQAVGADGTVLTANSAQADGVEWVSPLPSQTGQSGNYLTTNGTAASWGAISAGGMTLISTTTLSGASVTLSSIPQTYKELKIVLLNAYGSANSLQSGVRLNGDSTATQYHSVINGGSDTYQGNVSNGNATYIAIGYLQSGNTLGRRSSSIVQFPRYTDTTADQYVAGMSFGHTGAAGVGSYRGMMTNGVYNKSAAITSITIIIDSGTFTAGTVYLYGVN
jgi:hypothetical protein